MRKGIVMEQNKHYTIVMTSDGQFFRAKRLEDAVVGMEVQFTALTQRRYLLGRMVRDNRMKMAVATIVFLLAVLPIFSWYGSNQAYAYVNLDINPSVKMELNDHMKVISIIPQNEEAEGLIPLLKDWKKKDASEVTLQLIQLSQEQGYVNEKNQVLIGVSYVKDEPHDYSSQLETYLTNKILNLSITAFDIPEQIRKEAEETGRSANKLYAESLDQTGDSEPQTEENDRAIIQSFYKGDSSGSVADQSTSEDSSSDITNDQSSDVKRTDKEQEMKKKNQLNEPSNQLVNQSKNQKPKANQKKDKSEKPYVKKDKKNHVKTSEKKFNQKNDHHKHRNDKKYNKKYERKKWDKHEEGNQQGEKWKDHKRGHHDKRDKKEDGYRHDRGHH